MNEYETLAYHLSQFKTNPLYAVLGEAQSAGRTNVEVTEELLKGGLRIIQYREKTKSTLERYKECLEIRTLTQQYHATFIVNDSLELALATKADGIHVGQTDLPLPAVRQLVPDNMLIGLSINTLEQWQKAKKEGIAHYIGIGPVFPTQTKLDTSPQISQELEDAAIAGDDILPAVAISGIHKDNINVLQKRGFKRFAMVSELVGAEHIAENAKTLLQSVIEN